MKNQILIKILVTGGLLVLGSHAAAQNTNAHEVLENNGDTAAAAAEAIMGINSPPTGDERIREAVRDKGAQAGGSKSHADSYKTNDGKKQELVNKKDGDQ